MQHGTTTRYCKPNSHCVIIIMVYGIMQYINESTQMIKQKIQNCTSLMMNS